MSATNIGEANRCAVLEFHPECRNMIRRGALAALNVSGGKDSQTMCLLAAT